MKLSKIFKTRNSNISTQIYGIQSAASRNSVNSGSPVSYRNNKIQAVKYVRPSFDGIRKVQDTSEGTQIPLLPRDKLI